MIEHIHPDGESTPTVRELYEMKDGYAEAVTFDKDMNPTSFRLLDRGHALLGEIMRRNGAASVVRGTQSVEASAIMKLHATEKVARTKTGRRSSGSKSTRSPS